MVTVLEKQVDVIASNTEYYTVVEYGRLTSRTVLTGFHQYSEISQKRIDGFTFLLLAFTKPVPFQPFVNFPDRVSFKCHHCFMHCPFFSLSENGIPPESSTHHQQGSFLAEPLVFLSVYRGGPTGVCS